MLTCLEEHEGALRFLSKAMQMSEREKGAKHSLSVARLCLEAQTRVVASYAFVLSLEVRLRLSLVSLIGGGEGICAAPTIS